MKAMLLGYRKFDFKTKDGNDICGTKLYLGFEEEGVIGLTCSDKYFIGNDKKEVITIDLKQFVGKSIDVELNFKGKIACISA